MKNILLLNDFTPEAEHAISYATMLATALKARVLVWNVSHQATKTAVKRELVYVLKNGQQQVVRPTEQEALNNLADHPLINVLDDKDTINRTVHEIACNNNIQLVIKGVRSIEDKIEQHALKVVTKSCCPLLLVPKQAPLNLFKQIAYLADLRYCRNNINSYLKEVAHEVNANLSIAHISVASIPEPEVNYAMELYKKAIGPNPNNISLSFNQIKERNVRKAADVLIHVMKNDLLVMTYNKYHFSMLTSKGPLLNAAHDLNVPLMVFPS
ncbi:universal stress protein [uncultured Mucilaginibacter sp.]|uniref:universal stress protein n=1 Tax=uncultured Mucilaginibacter sp. TaxID=797541 RepID=UPI0025FD01F8|nr:universal stress protein [uncultured Mucilaginibacter sp.]